MTVPDLTQEVIELLAQERGLSSRKIAPSSRLLEDLGIDGDDAVEFFTEFERRYGADLEPLQQHWQRHFGPEGFGSPGMFLAAGLLLLSPIPLMPFGVSPALVWGFEITAVALWLWPLRQWPLKDRTLPVTVRDLVIAAETKRWPIAYGEES